ncbi:MAG TPA: sugar phosphate isomerase/epimerase [Bacillota bacterium]|nr:sugar phosphate isomerase/epimerase [Bacillota bacterium]HOK68846.1 sugar phosphate isomerase/epimerase [Bacillota bacterium]HPP85805.1 sugar phosphate isomerase/epimerase [Bacillota bacterium]
MFKIGVQVYSVRDDYAADVKQCLRKLKDIGYEGVELFGALANHPAEFLRDALKEAGLECCGFHTRWEEFETEEKIQFVVDYMKTLGCDYVIVPWMPEKTPEQWEEQIAAFNRLLERFRKEGLRFGFHAHKGEMYTLSNGRFAWDMIGEQTPEDFVMQVDIGNVLNGGREPIELYRKFASRGATVHYKAYSKEKGYDCAIGEDDIDWKTIVDISKNTPECEWIIVEKDAQDNYESITRSYHNLKKII